MKILLISENPAMIDLVNQTTKAHQFTYKAIKYQNIHEYYDKTLETASLVKYIFKTNYDIIVLDTIALEHLKQKNIVFQEDDVSVSPIILLVEDFKTLDLSAVQSVRCFYTLNINSITQEELYANFILLKEKFSINKRASSWALVDALTNLFNRRTFYNYLENFLLEYKAIRNDSFCLALLDLDYFKFINDTFGHTAGDEVLKVFAKILTENTRDADIVSRIGGEEFSIIFPKCNLHIAKKILERIREVMMGSSDIDDHLKVTFSAGLIQVPGGTIETSDQLVEAADSLLYKAKDTGRDRICI